MSLTAADVIKCIEGLDTEDEAAMKQAAWDIANQVWVSPVLAPTQELLHIVVLPARKAV